MKKILLPLLLLCATFAAAAPNPNDYNVTVHVIASRSRPYGSPVVSQYIDVIVNGKKYELRSPSQGVLALGDYKAKLKETHLNSYDIYQSYEFLFPDGKTRDYGVSGILQ